MRPRSLRTRLIAATAASILVAIVLLGAAAVLIVDHELHASLDHALRDRARDVARLSVSAPALLNAAGSLDAPSGGRQLWVEVLDARQRIVARSLSLGARLLPQGRDVRDAVTHGRTSFADAELAGRPVRSYVAPVAEAGGPAAGGAVIVASDTSDIDRALHRLRGLLALGAVVAAALAALAAALLTDRGLRPLRRLSAGAQEIERTGDPSRRLPPSLAEDELGELTTVLNRMLEALDRARQSERRFLADASHELRTPVTSLLGNAEYLARHGAGPAVIADLQHDAARLRRLVDDLLALERESAAAPGRERVELMTLVREAAEQHRRVRLGVVQAATTEGDAEALRRALGNLVENALVHGPADRPVTVSLIPRDGRVRLAVSDDGPGPDPAARDRLFQRFWRGPSASGRPGSGLGLAIAESIARRHGGRIDVEGSTFTIDLPAAYP